MDSVESMRVELVEQDTARIKRLARKRRDRERIKADPELLAKQAAYQASYRVAHAGKLREYGKEYRAKNAERLKRQRSEWRAKRLAQDSEGFLAARRRVAQESAERVLSRDPDGVRCRRAAYMRERRSSDKWKISGRMNARVSAALKSKSPGLKARRSWADLVGYTVDELVARLKRTLPLGYTWGDLMSGKLHIDHIVPVSAFNFTSAECHDFKRCWALSNLRLLPVLENIQKNARLMAPFQPSLL